MSFDPDYASVSLLLHGDATNGSTTFTDSSSTPKTVTAYGNTQISTAQSKFGGASMAFDGTGDYLSAPNDPAFYFGSGDFTVEGWARANGSISSTACFLGKWSLGTGGLQFIVGAASSNRAYFSLSNDGAASTELVGASNSIPSSVWFHFAGVRSGNVQTMYVNGVSVASGPIVGALFDNAAYSLTAGSNGFSQAFNGHLDELRITKGVARYTANFTPPSAPFAETSIQPALPARAAAPTPLGATAVLAIYGNNFFARAAAPGPLGTPATLAQLVRTAHTAAPGPLGTPSILTAALLAAYSKAPSPLGAPTALASMPLACWSAAPSPLGAPTATAYHDFTGQLGDVITRYTMDLITPTGTVRVPVSSWQATLQTGSSNYVQCVIPACTVWVGAILAATEFVISRRATLPNGAAIEMEMARAPADQAQFDQGPQRHTCTLSGYSDAFAEDLDPPATYDRTLAGVRSISTGEGNLRVRCAIDWLLRPGHRAYVNGTPFVVGYINCYAPSGFDAYMDAGSR